MARIKYSKAEKLAILALYEEGHHSIADIMAKFSVDPGTIRDWKRRYETNGEDGLTDATSWKSYSKDLKLAAINDYLSGHYSLSQVIQKYNISRTAVLRKWIKKYNSHRELKDTGKGMTNSMTNRRKTTLEERIQIVNYCLQHQKNYQLAAESYEVSYQQVYQWVKKFEAHGEEALQDKRGRNKEEDELTEEDYQKKSSCCSSSSSKVVEEKPKEQQSTCCSSNTSSEVKIDSCCSSSKITIYVHFKFMHTNLIY